MNITTKEAKSKYNISNTQMQNWVKAGYIKKIDKGVYDEDSIVQYMHTHKIKHANRESNGNVFMHMMISEVKTALIELKELEGLVSEEKMLELQDEIIAAWFDPTAGKNKIEETVCSDIEEKLQEYQNSIIELQKQNVMLHQQMLQIGEEIRTAGGFASETATVTPKVSEQPSELIKTLKDESSSISTEQAEPAEQTPNIQMVMDTIKQINAYDEKNVNALGENVVGQSNDVASEPIDAASETNDTEDDDIALPDYELYPAPKRPEDKGLLDLELYKKQCKKLYGMIGKEYIEADVVARFYENQKRMKEYPDINLRTATREQKEEFIKQMTAFSPKGENDILVQMVRCTLDKENTHPSKEEVDEWVRNWCKANKKRVNSNG